MILRSELSLSNDKIEKIAKKYQKAVEEGAESDRRFIAIQRELSANKYNSNLNYTTVSQKPNEYDQPSMLFSRKFSFTGDGRLSSTVVNENDSNMANATIVSPTKDYHTERLRNDRNRAQPHYSPLRSNQSKSRNKGGELKSSQTVSSTSITQFQKARIQHPLSTFTNE
jgi:hypothetical protein